MRLSCGLALLAALAGRAAATPCDALVPLAGPPELSAREADLGAPRTPCAERRLTLAVRGNALIDVPSFYGTLGGAGALAVRWPAFGLEWSAEARAADWRFVQNASLQVTELGFGPVAVGVLWPLSPRLLGWGVALAPSLRVVAPFSDSGNDHFAGAAEAAVHAAVRPRRWLSLHGDAALLAWAVAPPGAVDAFSSLTLAAGAGFPGRRLAAHVGLEAATGWYGWGGLDHLAARAGARLRTRRAGDWDLGALVPLLGEERTDVVVRLGWSVEL